MKLTPRRTEILLAISRGGILFQAVGYAPCHWRLRNRDNRKRSTHRQFFKVSSVNSGHGKVSAGLADKMERGGLIERFKPHAGIPAYRLTRAGFAALERYCGGMGQYTGTQFVTPA